MRKTCLLFCILFLSLTAVAQWTQRPLKYRHIQRPDFFLPLAMHFSDSTNGYILNNGGLMQYKNQQWLPVNVGDASVFTYTNLFSVSPRHTFFCSADGKIMHYDDQQNFTVLYTIDPESGKNPVLKTIFMTDSSNGWAAGDGGTLLKINGATVTLDSISDTYNFTDLYFDSPTHGWLIGNTQTNLGNFGIVCEYSNGAWAFHSFLDEDLYDIEFSSGGKGFISGLSAIYHFNSIDNVWEAENISDYSKQNHISMLNNDYGISVSDNNVNYIYQNGSWSPGPVAGVADLVSVYTTAEGKAWAISQIGKNNPADYNEGKIQELINGNWTDFSLRYLDTARILPVDYAITNLRGIDDKNIWLNGQHLGIPANQTWHDTIPVIYSDSFCTAARFFSRNFGLGTDGDIKEWDGQYWTKKNVDIINTDTSVVNLSMHVFDDTSAIVCRQKLAWSSGDVITYAGRYDYQSNSFVSSTKLDTRYPFDVDFFNKRNGWVVGDSGLTARFRSGSWQVLPSVTNHRLNAVSMADSVVAWAVGDDGILLRYNGNFWIKQTLPTHEKLYDIYFTNEHDGWIVGDSGLIFHYDGTQWLKDSSGTTNTLYAIYMVDSAYGFAGGDNGMFLQFNTRPAPAPQPRRFCENGDTYYTYHPEGSGYSFQWQVNTGSGFENITDNVLYAGSSTDSLRIIAMPSTMYGYQFRCIATRNSVDSISNVEELRFINHWTGAADHNWENPLNWTCGSIPGSNTDVDIEAGEIILNTTAIIRSIALKPGVNITIAPGGNLVILH